MPPLSIAFVQGLDDMRYPVVQAGIALPGLENQQWHGGMGGTELLHKISTDVGCLNLSRGRFLILDGIPGAVVRCTNRF
ncbi:MAG: hypothetical protein JO362_15325 [Streptomycetaceae bacterium]|nr:hypothetical protein [Streptomycetaceae bacterium]